MKQRRGNAFVCGIKVKRIVKIGNVWWTCRYVASLRSGAGTDKNWYKVLLKSCNNMMIWWHMQQTTSFYFRTICIISVFRSPYCASLSLASDSVSAFALNMSLNIASPGTRFLVHYIGASSPSQRSEARACTVATSIIEFTFTFDG